MKKIILLTLAVGYLAFGQGIADGVRLSKTKQGLDARSAALGISYQGLVDNSAALYFNPAGLSLIPSSEIGFGINVLVGHNDNLYLGETRSSDYSNETIQNATIVVPFNDSDNNFTFAFGYFNDNDYELISNLEAFNTNNTYISYLAGQGDVIPYEHYLANENNVTPIQDSLLQNLDLFEEGNINRITAGFSFDLNEKISFGFSGAARVGDFSQSFFLTEFDRDNIYNAFSEDQSTSDMTEFRYERRINQSFQAVTGTLGILAKPTENSRLSFSLDLPQYVSVEDNAQYSSFSTHEIREPSQIRYFDPEGDNYITYEYEVILPMKFRIGYSINLLGLTASVGAEYTDLNNLEFQSTAPFIEDYNVRIPDQLGAEFSWGMGLEYKIPFYPAFVRASYGETTNPWVDGRVDLGSARNAGVGGGLLLGDNFMLDVAYNVSLFDEGRFLYNETAQPFQLVNTVSNFVIGITYRY
jgi:hypothetical protein